MFLPGSVLEQVQQGEISQDWRVFQGRGNPGIVALFSGCFTLIFTGILCVISLSALTFFGLFNLFTSNQDPSTSSPFPPDYTTPSAPSFNPLGILPGSVGLFLLIPLALAVLVGILVYKRVTRQRDSRLVITPTGVVECTNFSHPAAWQYKVLDFDTILRLDLRVRASSTTDHNATTGFTTTSTNVSFWLDVSHLDGSLERWPINKVFGRPETIAQYILEARATYAARAS